VLPPARPLPADNIHDGIDDKPAAKSEDEPFQGKRESLLGKIENPWKRSRDHETHPRNQYQKKKSGSEQRSHAPRENIRNPDQQKT
jgi:hypothetical protein